MIRNLIRGLLVLNAIDTIENSIARKTANRLKQENSPDDVDDIPADKTSEPLFEVSDDLYNEAVRFTLSERKVSTSFIQRHLQIGYNRATAIIDRMEKEGLVSSANNSGKRKIISK